MYLSTNALTALLQAAAAHDPETLTALLAEHAPDVALPPALDATPVAYGEVTRGQRVATVYAVAGRPVMALREFEGGGRMGARWYLPDHTFIDARWRHGDLPLVIPADAEVALYHFGGDEWVLDHAPATLGYPVRPLAGA